jgi:hypothetical protein
LASNSIMIYYQTPWNLNSMQREENINR